MSLIVCRSVADLVTLRRGSAVPATVIVVEIDVVVVCWKYAPIASVEGWLATSAMYPVTLTGIAVVDVTRSSTATLTFEIDLLDDPAQTLWITLFAEVIE